MEVIIPIRTFDVPHNRESPPSIDIHGVKRDLDQKHWCILSHLSQSFMGDRTLNLGDSVFLYTGVMTIFISVIQDYIQNHEIYSNMIIRKKRKKKKGSCILLDKA